MRRFKLYQALEARYEQLKAEKDALKEEMTSELAAKDVAIVALAKQLAFAGTLGPEVPADSITTPGSVSVSRPPTPHVPTKSGTMARVSGPHGQRTLEDLVRATEEAVRADSMRPKTGTDK